ncbi:hypothetical protein [Undibacterium sp. Tian12W]|uniref:hypothetical protein n=1 Tax=Undibacterium sp. Tian12W TaxID=3413054 RepID=UPI003BF09BE8
MTKKEEFFQDIGGAIEAWAEVASKELTDPNFSSTWADSQEPFKQLQQVFFSNNIPKEVVTEMFVECFQGLAHSFLCILDGATALSDTGRIYVVDEDGIELGDGLHEEFEDYFFDRKMSKKS